MNWPELGDINALDWSEYMSDLKVRGRSELTIACYRDSLGQLASRFPGKRLLALTPADLRQHFIFLAFEYSGATLLVRFKAAKAFYNWAVKADLVMVSPMAKLPLPAVQEKIVPIPRLDKIQALLRSMAGKRFEDLRDTAIIRVLSECGLRIGELSSLKVDDVDLSLCQLRVLGKGNKWRVVPFGAKTTKALIRYLRARPEHPNAGLEMLWLSQHGNLTLKGTSEMLTRRCRQAGLPHMYPHQLRHFAADAFFAAGGSDQDAMRIFGWTSDVMPRVYGRANASNRAVENARKLSLGDRI